METNSKFKTFLLSKTGKWTMIALFYVIIFLLGMLAVGSRNEIFVMAYGIIVIVFGWLSLSKITPNIFLVLPIVGWLIFFVVKFFLSIFVGMFTTPFYVSKLITKLVQKGIK